MPLHDGGHVPISPGSALDVGLLYRSEGASVRGNLTVRSNDPLRRGVSVVPMTVEAHNGVVASPNPLDFGRVPRGEVRTQELTLYNLSVAPIELRDLFVANNELEIISGASMAVASTSTRMGLVGLPSGTKAREAPRR